MREPTRTSKAGGAIKSTDSVPTDTANLHIKASSGTSGASKQSIAKRDNAPAKLHWQDFRKVFQSTPIARIDLIRNGVPAVDFKRFLTGLGVPQQQVYRMLAIATATVNRKASRNETFTCGESAKVVGLAKLIGQIETMLAESGTPSALAGFHAGKWLVGWMMLPIPALGGRLPADYMDTIEGQEMIGRLLAKMQSGAYA